MKKYLKLTAAVLSLVLVISLCGCGNKEKAESKPKADTPSSSNVTGSEDNTSSEQSSEQNTSSESSQSGTQTNGSDSSAAKSMTSSQGENYLILKPSVLHPGVAEMDAVYEMVCSDKLGAGFVSSDFTLKADNKAVKINGNIITVPWSVRNSGKPVTVTAVLKSNPIKKGSYTFNFRQYVSAPTFFEDFNTLDTNVWETPEEDDVMGIVKDGNLIFTVKGEGQKRFEMMTKNFKQAYGCFTARIDMPKKGNGNAAFWMMTTDGDRYIKNPAMPSQSGGEIDVVEYFGNWGKRWSAALHWNAWNPNYLSSDGDDKLPAEDIQNGYHTFSVVWTDSAIYWYYDGGLARVYEGAGVAKGSAGMRLLIQLQPLYEDGWGGVYNPKDYPYEMKTDYIKAYQFK